MTCYTCGNSIYICIDNILTINIYYNVLRVAVQGGGGGGRLVAMAILSQTVKTRVKY